MSQINTFYINRPMNFTKLYMFNLYINAITKIFAKSNNNVTIVVINNNNYVPDSRLDTLVKDASKREKKDIKLRYDKFIKSHDVPSIQEEAFLNYKDCSTIKDTLLTYDYNDFVNFSYNVSAHFIDLIQALKTYDKYEEKFSNRMNILKQLTYKSKKFIVLNISTFNNIVMPDIYYIKAIALLFNILKLKDYELKNIRIIVCYDSKFTDQAYNLFINNISKHLKNITTKNFFSYKEISKYYSQLTDDEFIFYLNLLAFPTICSQNPDSLIPCFLKDYHKTLDWDLFTINIFSKKLFTNTLITRSFGI